MAIWKTANLKMIFVDTGAFAGKYNKRDQYRDNIIPCFELIFQNNLILVTSNAVVYEAYTRILQDTKGNIESCLEFLDCVLQGKIAVLRVSQEDEKIARKTIEKFDDKEELTLVDALSSVLMEKNNIIKVFTTDKKHFCSMQFLTIPPISNLLQYLEFKATRKNSKQRSP